MHKLTVETHTATIWIGFKNRATGEVESLETARAVCRDYCDGDSA